MNKVCSKCCENKDINDFGDRKDRKCGVKSRCKECLKKDRIVYKNRNNINNRNRIIYIKMKICSCCKKDKETNNFSRCNSNSDGLQYICKECEKIKCKESRQKHKDRLNAYAVRKRADNIQYKLRHNISSRINQELKSNSLRKDGLSTFKNILPYTANELIIHIESLWEPWMNWDNYGFGEGKWVIDHIIPDSAFNYKSVEDEEFQKCWALSNLRPLGWYDNLLKSNKVYA